MKRLLAIVGPTATGKTALALALAQRLGGEVVGADSRQVYRCLDIGTAKPTPQERSLVKHHLIDVAEPDQTFTLALYLEMARLALDDIWARGRLPLLVGGTGLYVWALLEGWRVPRVPPNQGLRRELEAFAAAHGGEGLYRELEGRDPLAARRIDPHNLRRVIRALEVSLGAGVPFSRLRSREAPPFDVLILGLTAPRPHLYHRIDARIDGMIEGGWVEEVRGLLARGYPPLSPALSGIGYRELVGHVEGRVGLGPAVDRIKFRSHRLARHQYAWFRPGDRRINWLDITNDPLGPASGLAQGWLKLEAEVSA